MHKLFFISIFLKGINGVFEILIGLMAVFISRDTLTNLVDLITRRELLQDPTDAVAGYLITTIQNYSVNTQFFIAVYLLIHGVLKIFLVLSLMQRRLWAYPIAMVVFFLFLIYQIYEYIQHPSISLIVISIIDALVIGMTYYEYRSIRTKGWHQETGLSSK